MNRRPIEWNSVLHSTRGTETGYFYIYRRTPTFPTPELCESGGGRPVSNERFPSACAQDMCVKVQMAVLGSPSLISLMVSVDVKQHSTNNFQASEVRSCVKVEVAVLGSPSLTVRRVSVKVRQHSTPTFQERKDERAPKRQADPEQGSWALRTHSTPALQLPVVSVSV